MFLVGRGARFGGGLLASGVTNRDFGAVGQLRLAADDDRGVGWHVALHFDPARAFGARFDRHGMRLAVVDDKQLRDAGEANDGLDRHDGAFIGHAS